MPLSPTGAELLFEVFSQRYERGSILVTTNLPFDEWTEVFGSERLTGALLDRLTHHVHILEMNGDSYRLRHSRDNAASQASERLLGRPGHLPDSPTVGPCMGLGDIFPAQLVRPFIPGGTVLLRQKVHYLPAIDNLRAAIQIGTLCGCHEAKFRHDHKARREGHATPAGGSFVSVSAGRYHTCGDGPAAR